MVDKKLEYEQAWESYDGVEHLPRQLNSLKRIHQLLVSEKDLDSLRSLYHLYIYCLCSFCESVLRNTYESVLSVNWNNIKDIQHQNLIEQAVIKLKEINWEALMKEDVTYLGAKIPQNLKSGDSYAAINILFKLRNLLIHGNNFEKVLIAEYPKETMRYEITGKGKKVYEFLQSKKLITKDKISTLEHYELNADCVSYFISQVIEFIKVYSEFLVKLTSQDHYKYYYSLVMSCEQYKVQ